MQTAFVVCESFPDQMYLTRLERILGQHGIEVQFVRGSLGDIEYAIAAHGTPDLVIFHGDGVTRYMRIPGAFRILYPEIPLIYLTYTHLPTFGFSGIWALYIPIRYSSDADFVARLQALLVKAKGWQELGQ